MEEVLLTKMHHPKKETVTHKEELKEFSDIEKIADLLDEYVRPAVEQDGIYLAQKFERYRNRIFTRCM